MKLTMIPIVDGAIRTFPQNHSKVTGKKLEIRTEHLPDYSTVKISTNILKNTGNMMRFTVIQTSLKKKKILNSYRIKIIKKDIMQMRKGN